MLKDRCCSQIIRMIQECASACYQYGSSNLCRCLENLMCEFGDKQGMLLKNQELPKGLLPYIWLNWILSFLYMFNSSFIVPITGLSRKNYKTTFKDMPRWCVMCTVYVIYCYLVRFGANHYSQSVRRIPVFAKTAVVTWLWLFIHFKTRLKIAVTPEGWFIIWSDIISGPHFSGKKHISHPNGLMQTFYLWNTGRTTIE